jgi:hypothetical protein
MEKVKQGNESSRMAGLSESGMRKRSESAEGFQAEGF